MDVDLSHVPAWVVATTDEIREAWRVTWRLLEGGFLDQRDMGSYDTLTWLVLGEWSPMTHRRGDEFTRENARAESWVALCLAAGQPEPAAQDWARLGAEPRPAVPDSSDVREYAYGCYRALSWLLGVREDWPIYTSRHRAAGVPRERPHMVAPMSARNTETWLSAARASRDQAEQDALRHWRHVRQLADGTAAAAG